MTKVNPSSAQEAPQELSVTRRFSPMLTIEQVREILNVGLPTVYALLNSGDLRGIQIGGRKMWRISVADLEAYIEQCYRQTEENIAAGSVVTEDDEAGG